MSEITPTPEELVEEIAMTVDDATVIPIPIDPTLSIQGEAADAKATGDAIAGVIDDMRVNEKAAVNKKFIIYANDIKMSGDVGAPTIAEAIGGAEDRDASSIMYDTEHLITVKDALDGLNDSLDSEVADIYDAIASEVADINDVLDSELTEEQIDEIFDEVFGEEGE